MSKLLSPIQINNISLKNRIVMAPMCQYSATDGFAGDWHYLHYTTRAIGGCAAIIQEATAIRPDGRITYADLGIWKDEHIDELKKIVTSVIKYGAVPGIQLAHAGRKASCELPWKGGRQLHSGENSWKTIAPSALAFDEGEVIPHALNIDEIQTILEDFKKAAERAVKAGYQIIEIHAAHGYLIHQFLSPVSNHRTDEYGGSFENRIRFLLEVVDSILPTLSSNHSLWVRISATDWVDNGWNLEESVKLSAILKSKGVDVMDISTGGNVPHVRMPIGPNYQVPFATEIKEKAQTITGAVGLITQAKQAEELLTENKCDLIFLGRELLRNPYFAWAASKELDNTGQYPLQYERSYK